MPEFIAVGPLLVTSAAVPGQELDLVLIDLHVGVTGSMPGCREKFLRRVPGLATAVVQQRAELC
jgi:hypothetical protein